MSPRRIPRAILRQMDRLLTVRAKARSKHLFNGGSRRSSHAISPADELAVPVSTRQKSGASSANHPEDAVHRVTSRLQLPPPVVSSCRRYSRVPTVTSRSHATLLTTITAVTRFI
jgi:hypothetical protein